MGSRDKLKRFSAIKKFSNVLEFPEQMAGQWNGTYFKNDHPITVELACGKGEYTVALAHQHPERNYIGVDVKAERIYIGAKQALADQMTNVAFLRVLIEGLSAYFAPGEIDELWITFPDPFPRDKQAKHRLTSPRFLPMYRKLLRPGGLLHLKTDALDLFNYSLDTLAESGCDILEASMDIYGQPQLPNPALEIKTNFEGKHLSSGRTIQYICAQWPLSTSM